MANSDHLAGSVFVLQNYDRHSRKFLRECFFGVSNQMRQDGMQNRFGLSLLPAVLSMIIGCGGAEAPSIVRDPVSKVTGKLLINGKPEASVLVRLNPVGSSDPDKKKPDGMTDAEGNFSIGTYEGSGDGAPNGEYAVTFQWGMRALMGGNYGGDKFAGKYIDPEKSEFKLTVAGEPIDMGVIELTAPEGASFELTAPKRGAKLGGED